MSNFSLSIIAPAYNEEENINTFYEKIKDILDRATPNWEIVFINDGSSDNTLNIIRDLAKVDRRIKYLSFSRNFGKEIALTAGLDYADCDAVIPIDTDLQDPPELILEMVKHWQDGNDVVYAKRKVREGETFFKLLTASMFYKLMANMSDIDIPENVGDFRLLDKKVVKELRRLKEKNRFMKGIFSWVGFKNKEILFERKKRDAGTTKFNFLRLWHFAIDGITSFSMFPLRIFLYSGSAIMFLSFIYALVIVFKTIFIGKDLAGYPSIMVTILFFGGMNMFAIGVIGEYLGRVYEEVKNRPLYIVSESNLDKI